LHRSAPLPGKIDTRLIELLQETDAFTHPVNHVSLIETHISWVLLAGEYAYKIKKPLDLGFLDFTDLSQRHACCEDEIRLNKPWAPEIYMDVVPIALNKGKPVIGASGMAVEYAVRMRRFGQSQRLDLQLEIGEVSADDMQELAEKIAERHTQAEQTDRSKREHAVQRAIDLMRENFEPLEDSIDASLLQNLRDWTDTQLKELKGTIRHRFDDGYFRECHGDLHLGNLVRLEDGITAFDCIEFNEDLRSIDVIADIAFLVMDLVANHRIDLAIHFLNRYLECTGDYDGMRVFNLYFAYRCLVRAKIAVIRSSERQDPDDAQADLNEAHDYCKMARQQSTVATSLLVAMYGFSGSGKTWVASRLMSALPAIRVRSDLERKRLFGLEETADSHSGLATGIYSDAASENVYEKLGEIAEALLSSGHNVILDASFIKYGEREVARNVAERTGSDFVLLQVVAGEAVLRNRIRAREELHEDASEADTQVLALQSKHFESLRPEEKELTVTCRSEDLNVAKLVGDIRQVLEKNE
jgi:aminoglycoside phosphotransferase family enzyme/predicted kinase